MVEQRRKADIDIAQIRKDIEHLVLVVKEQHDKCDVHCDKMTRILNGNGNDGLVTDVAILKNDRKNQPTLRQTTLLGSIGGAITAMLVLIGKAITGN